MAVAGVAEASSGVAEVAIGGAVAVAVGLGRAAVSAKKKNF